MEWATPGNFELFQAKIFPVVDYLISQPDHANHAFTKHWLQLNKLLTFRGWQTSAGESYKSFWVSRLCLISVIS